MNKKKTIIKLNNFVQAINQGFSVDTQSDCVRLMYESKNGYLYGIIFIWDWDINNYTVSIEDEIKNEIAETDIIKLFPAKFTELLEGKSRYRIWDEKEKRYLKNNKTCFEKNNLFKGEQCTFLEDKNKKIIYEGDIVDFNFTDPFSEKISGNRYEVRHFDNNNFYLVGYKYNAKRSIKDKLHLKFLNKKPDTWNIFSAGIKDYKIIGNIHENPELVEN